MKSLARMVVISTHHYSLDLVCINSVVNLLIFPDALPSLAI